MGVMPESRPNPDELLARVKTEEAKKHRGKLRIFFGYAAGVGKTYAMLLEARRQKAAGTEVVVGYCEPHGRAETETLLEGLESLPFKMVEYRGVNVREFDLDAALARRPQLLLVDELAHTNAEGLRHAKRWQDVQELLAAGIDVYTTLNVQHLESLNDVVAQVTGVIVRETLPDSIFEQADEIELVDITPEQLMERLKAGKVYVTPQAQRALNSFFQRANLVALRELSLRRSAERISADVQSERASRGGEKTWPTSEKLLVCVSPSPHSVKLIRSAKRMSASLQAEWIAVSVETPASARMSAPARERLLDHLHRAEQLGAETVTLSAVDAADEIVRYARSRNVTKIIVGKTDEPRWKSLFFGSFLEDLLRKSGEIDIYVIRGIGEPSPADHKGLGEVVWDWAPIAWGTVIVAVSGAIAELMRLAGLAEANLIAVFLLGVLLTALRFGRWPGIYASIASVLVFDFLFVPPNFTFAVSDVQYLFTFGVFLLIALTTSALAARVSEHSVSTRERERRTQSLYRLTRQLAGASGSDFLLGMAGKQMGELFGGEVVIYLPDEKQQLQPRFGKETAVARNPNSQAVAQWVFDHDQIAGSGTDTLPQAAATFVPLTGSQTVVGVMAVHAPKEAHIRSPDQQRLLETCSSQIALALERDKMTLEASRIFMEAETERLRSSLLASVSHDLRTPLAAISGAASALLEASPSQDETVRRELLQSIFEESLRLSRLVENLLQMTRIESRGIEVKKQWEVLEEVVGSALRRLETQLRQRKVEIEIPANLPLVPMDGLLMEQVLINLLENAARYTPPDAAIKITARASAKECILEVSDNGPGLAKGEEEKIFEKFYRGSESQRPGDHRRGAGLGLAICRAIAQAHGGTIRAENQLRGGTRFLLSIPLEGPPPGVPATLQLEMANS
jgi:two-component system, OmpR family, sensor histidine kinase KdpD